MSTQIRGNTQILADSITNTEINSAAAIGWSKISKTSSSLADLATRSASDLSSGTLALARGGTNADLSATGGSNQVLKQASAGAAITVGTLAIANLSDGSNAALLNAANTLTGANVFDQAAQTFKANSSGDAIKIVGRAAGSNFGNFKFFDNDGTTQRGYVQSSSVSGGQINFVANQKFTLEASSGAVQIYSSSVLEVYPDLTNLRFKVLGSDGHTYTDNGTVSSLSDARTKERVRPFTAGLSEVRGILSDGLHLWRHTTGEVSVGGKRIAFPRAKVPFVGVTAQIVQRYLPDAVSVDRETGLLTMTTGPILWALCRSVVDLDDRVKQIEAQLGL